MKVITLICESFNRYDLGNISLPGVARFNFDTGPSTISHETLRLMMNLEFNESLSDPKCLSKKIKTRLISNFWPKHTDPKIIDPLASIECIEGRDNAKKKMEPDSSHFKTLLDFLDKEFYKSDYQWLIYWPYIGHAGMNLRLPEENSGIPKTCEKTLQSWFHTIKTMIFPRIEMDETIILIHNDHGTARIGRSFNEAMYDGFIFIKTPEIDSSFPSHEDHLPSLKLKDFYHEYVFKPWLI